VKRPSEPHPFFVASSVLANDEVRAEYCERLGIKESGGRLVLAGFGEELERASEDG
jgi:hypothetical protein